MKLLSKKTDIDFLKLRKIAMVFSALLIIASLVSLFSKGLNFGLDFTGGTSVEIQYGQAADLSDIRKQLEAANYKGAVVQNFGTSQDVKIRIPDQDFIPGDEIGGAVIELLQANDSSVVEKYKGYVGPVVGEELKEQGVLAMLVALICIMIYVALRFEWKFSLGSVAALAHDVIITLGFFSISQMEFDLTVLAALLAVIGYSLNDTIVVFDRIRENFLRMRKGEAKEVINTSLNQTLARTLMTSITTLLVLLALFFFGGETIHAFATALIVGVFIGTYSSIYVASIVALALGVKKEDLMPPEVEKEGAEFDLP
ncbi:MAG: protein translocase subunit SecF [Gammaproteobacteria bacterium]|nr:protein translocase subunit SecF [Gammaproteobacteria bacterium]